MVSIGVDMGAKNVKVVVLDDNAVIGKALVVAGFDTESALQEALQTASGEAGIDHKEVSSITATGAGRKDVPMASNELTEVGAAARGALFFFKDARTVIDVGAEEGRGVRFDAEGRVIDFVVNEKCAAGAGAFTEAMARALEVPLEEFGLLSLESDREIPMNAQCAVFAESEVVSLVHAKTPKQDIARAVHDAIASRITSMVRRVGVEEQVALVGGLAYNVGFIDSLKRDLETDIHIPPDPEYAAAIGAAIVAAERGAKASEGGENS
ncbi:acyl-CoA dehydratase activase [Gemmatimonadota bacterium]